MLLTPVARAGSPDIAKPRVLRHSAIDAIRRAVCRCPDPRPRSSPPPEARRLRVLHAQIRRRRGTRQTERTPRTSGAQCVHPLTNPGTSITGSSNAIALPAIRVADCNQMQAITQPLYRGAGDKYAAPSTYCGFASVVAARLVNNDASSESACCPHASEKCAGAVRAFASPPRIRLDRSALVDRRSRGSISCWQKRQRGGLAESTRARLN